MERNCEEWWRYFINNGPDRNNNVALARHVGGDGLCDLDAKEINIFIVDHQADKWRFGGPHQIVYRRKGKW